MAETAEAVAVMVVAVVAAGRARSGRDRRVDTFHSGHYEYDVRLRAGSARLPSGVSQVRWRCNEQKCVTTQFLSHTAEGCAT